MYEISAWRFGSPRELICGSLHELEVVDDDHRDVLLAFMRALGAQEERETPGVSSIMIGASRACRRRRERPQSSSARKRGAGGARRRGPREAEHVSMHERVLAHLEAEIATRHRPSATAACSAPR